MRRIPAPMLDAILNVQAEPVAELVLEMEAGLRAWKNRTADWTAYDPAGVRYDISWTYSGGYYHPVTISTGTDTNIALDRVPDAVTLAPGAYVPANTNVGGGLPAKIDWQLRVQETGTTYVSDAWAGLTGGGHSHSYAWTYTHITDPQPLRWEWTPDTSLHLTELSLALTNSGDVDATVDVRIEDAQGNQLGPSGRVTVAANTTVVERSKVQNLSADIVKGKAYTLVIELVPPADNTFKPKTIGADVTHTIRLGIYSDTRLPNSIPKPYGGRIPYGGDQLYAASGSITRTFDIGDVPAANNGEFMLLATVPVGASVAATAWYTNDPNLAAQSGTTGWNSYGDIITNWSNLPAARYWRIQFDLTANAAGDEAPVIHRAEIRYGGQEIVFATHADTASAGRITALRALDGMRAFGSQLTSQPGQSVHGVHQFALLPEPEVQALPGLTLKAHRASARIGIAGSPNRVEVAVGRVRELLYRQERYTLEIEDPVDMNLRVPNTRIGAQWDSLVYDPTTNGGKDWHLVDVAKDLLIGRALIPRHRIDEISFEIVRSLLPNRIGSRTISRPTPVRELLAELAVLLESHWLVRGGVIALVPEPPSDMAPVEMIGPADIRAGSLQYRRGWRELANGILVLTGYDPNLPGSGDQQYATGEVMTDATSVSAYGEAIYRTLYDKWNVPQSEIQALENNFLSRWANGRRVVDLEGSLRLAALEPGDVVRLVSRQLPPGEGDRRWMVARSDIDWFRQAVKLTVMEVI